jgi:hypothetical protein
VFQNVTLEKNYFHTLLKPLKSLTYLDLSCCDDLGTLDCLDEMSRLVSLVLYSVHRIQNMIPSICKIKSLRFDKF